MRPPRARIAILIFACCLTLPGPGRVQESEDIGALNAEIKRLSDAGKYAEAIPIAERAVALGEATLGPHHLDVAKSLYELAQLAGRQGRFADAEAPAKRCLAIREEALGPNHPDVAASLNILAEAVAGQARQAEAEQLVRRALTIRESLLGANHPDVAESLSTLARIYGTQGRRADAERLIERAIAIDDATPGADPGRHAFDLTYLAKLYTRQRRIPDAERLTTRALSIVEGAYGASHPMITTALNQLATLYETQGRAAEAEPLFKRSLAIQEATLGPNHLAVAGTLGSLARLYHQYERYPDAAPLYQRRSAIIEAALGPDHTALASSFGTRAWLAFGQRDWGEAALYWRRAADIIQRRTERGLGIATADTETGSAEDPQRTWYFRGLVKAIRRLMADGHDDPSRAARDTFETAQWAETSEAAQSLAQMAARSAKGDPALAGVVRERQDLVGEWQAKDRLLIATKGEAPDKRNAEAEAALQARLAEIDARLKDIDARLAREFPNYAALAQPRSASLQDIQADLGDDEAMVVFLDTNNTFEVAPQETFIWVVTRTESRWVRSDLGTEALESHVAALRCGLDLGAWQGDGKERCRELIGRDRSSSQPILPFDTAKAYALYRGLFAEVEDLLGDRQLFVVPSGALQKLPLHVLVTEPPRDGAAPAWLMRRHAITVLPSVASLKALRERAPQPTAHHRSYIAFANPLLDGRSADDKTRAALAEAMRDCAAVAQLGVIAGLRQAYAELDDQPTLGGANTANLRLLPPVPQTANLACDVAQVVGAIEDDIHLGARATEASVKDLSRSGALASYAVVNFATHGAVAGELKISAEPGLVLTPPETGTDEDDGYLSASEIAALKLDADWVVLSACNTAAGGAKNAEALSGLARAFFYAGARSLLVSHWAVREKAAVDLVTGAITAGHAGWGRAEAMRHSMLALADSPDAQASHPSYWAPFVVVGESGRR